MIKVTNVNVKKVEDDKLVKGIARVVIDNCFVINNIRIIKKSDGKTFLAFPSIKIYNEYFDMCHPINKETRAIFEEAILEEYEKIYQ